MNKIIIGLIALVLAALTGCSSASDTASAGETQLHGDELFLTLIEGTHFDFSGADQQAIAAGHAVCDALDAGSTWTDLVDIGMDNGLDAYDAGYVVGAAVSAYCPEHEDDLP